MSRDEWLALLVEAEEFMGGPVLAAVVATAMSESVPDNLRNHMREKAQQEMHGALARGDRKAYRRALAELRSLDGGQL